MTPPTYPMRPVNGGPLTVGPNATKYSGNNHGFVFQPKLNGWRALVHAPSGIMWNRHGERLSIQKEFLTALDVLRGLPFPWLDVEVLDRRHDMGRGHVVVLDWLAQDMPHAKRRTILQKFIPGAPLFGFEVMLDPGVSLVPEVTLAYRLDEVMHERNAELGCVFYEGIVAKKADALYNYQLRSDSEESPHWIKHRFTTK